MNIEMVKIDSIKPYYNNPRKNDKAVKQVANSIKLYGFNQPIVVDKDRVIVVGHTRWKAANSLKMTEVPVCFMPDNIEDHKVKAYRIADNKLNELAEWDDEALQKELQELYDEIGSIEDTGFDNDYLQGKSDGLYTTKVDTPLYEIQGLKPKLTELYNDTRTQELLDEIRDSNLPEDEKLFLKLAAHRHTELRFDLIAEYYAHAHSELQTLMENSALVIIDFDRAIELGYVKLSEEIAETYLGITEDEA
tara:strand:+ start:2892 stop:3638 length:747 start_codon:yes stop_codon:yes gene_type:complete